MEFEGPLELPGEANPLTEAIFLKVLEGAASSDNQRIQTSAKQLEEWQTQDGYYVHLKTAFVDKRLPMEMRYLAIIQLKNGIDKYWRKTAKKSVLFP
jgi:hypothetical protein